MKTEIKPMVNLNVNPCKMCMPLGAMTAFYGIKKCVSILHGSQGCSTYIRRHMATHYNEPVDIASSSLTEHGTVYGGEENLIKGLNNLIELYHPEVIGVATTCLAETIGEDVPRIIEKFREQYPNHAGITIIPVQSPGYGGSQFDGFFRALYSIVSKVPMSTKKHEKINIITGAISPADARFLKNTVKAFGLEAILLPDISDNLDGGYKKDYQRLPSEGTSLEDISSMVGAKYTIEFSSAFTIPSPAEYLYETYGVPYSRLHLPVGLKDNDAFYHRLETISGVALPIELKKERGRYIDAMIDSHKYNSEGRAAIFGEPDFVLSTAKLCTENGLLPVLTATGTKCDTLLHQLEATILKLSKMYFDHPYKILSDVDFKDIEAEAKGLEANLLIGNSDGRRMEENLHLPLVRRGFPIHDRMGGQRLRMLGYEGSLQFLDEITNVILTKKERGFRKELFEEYFIKRELGEKENLEPETKKKTKPAEATENKVQEADMEDSKKIEHAIKQETDMEHKTKMHPCYNCGAGTKYARIHMPVAPKCNIQCNYCVRKFDCPNESRPGVTTQVLSPTEAFERFKEVKEKMTNLTVVGIAGPGDALANFNETRETLRLIREYDKHITFCLSTNGLMLPEYANELIELGVSHVTVTLNAVDPIIAGKIYHHIMYKGKMYIGENAGAILLSNQLAGIRILTNAGIVCKVNIVMLKGINDEHIPEVVAKVKELGVYITNIMPMIPVEGSAFEHIERANNKELMELRNRCGILMKQMYHCKQCRADAVGLLGEDKSIEFTKQMAEKNAEAIENKTILRFAVASKSGMLIDEHFGHASEFYIYEVTGDRAVFKEQRQVNKYCTGNDECDEKTDKITKTISMISDCNGVIAMRIGESPRQQLEKRGIKVFSTYDRVNDAVLKAASNIL